MRRMSRHHSPFTAAGFPTTPLRVPTVRLKYLSFHPSIWPRMIGEVSRDATPGSLVRVLDKQGEPFGWGLWNPAARMPLRVVSNSKDDLDESFFLQAIERARTLPRDVLKVDR